jgi:hypothetical protein
MPTVRCSRAEIDETKQLTELAARPRPSEKEIEAQASQDGDAWTDDEVAEAEQVLRRKKFRRCAQNWD